LKKSRQPSKKNVIKGIPLVHNAAIEVRYRDALDLMIVQMTRETERQLKELFTSDLAKETFAQDASIAAQARILMSALSDRFTKLFSHQSRRLSKSMLNSVDNESASSVQRSLASLGKNITLKQPMDSSVHDVVKASITENVSLIKSIPQQYLTQVEQQVMRSITTGNGLQDLEPFLKKHQGITERRAKLIANDQTKKAYSSINKARMQESGIKKFEWLHSGGGREPRPYHLNKWPAGLNGGIFSFNDLPVIDEKTGERGIAGQLCGCRCTMIPIIDFGEDD
jgi:SPP1 gp7 family putative phage head morphogenesis protein